VFLDMLLLRNLISGGIHTFVLTILVGIPICFCVGGTKLGLEQGGVSTCLVG
jgi:hypothetical protein